MNHESPYSEALARFEGKPLITVGCGTTCGCLGDERNLREFLIADETAQRLRDAGHAVISLLIDDNLDPLSARQLRVAFDKDELMVEKWSSWNGKPLAHVPDPWECHVSYAAHFEAALMERLQGLGCFPNIVSTSALYDGGLYAPYVRRVLANYDQAMEYLTTRFAGYQPETLFWPICPECGCIDETKIEKSDKTDVKFYCRRCQTSHSISHDDVKGKLNWKLDCAVRWVLLGIDAEPFSKAYLEPRTGSFAVAQEVSKTLFGGHDVFPLRYGSAQVEKAVSYRLLPSLPGDILRSLFTEKATSDLRVTRDQILNIASRHKVEYGLSYLDCIRQLVPMWLLRPQSLSDRQREVVAHGIRFAEDFLGQEIALQLPTREKVDDISEDILEIMHDFLVQAIQLREDLGAFWDAFCEPAKQLVASLGENKHEVISHLRGMLGQKQGVPAPRLLFLLPINYLQVLEYLLDLKLSATNAAASVALRLAA